MSKPNVTLAIDFYRSKEVAVSFEASRITNSASDYWAQYLEVYAACLYILRQGGNLGSTYRSLYVQQLAKLEATLRTQGPPAMEDFTLVSHRGPGKKRFLAAVFIGEQPAFRLHIEGFGRLGRGLPLYGPASAVALTLYLAQRRDTDFREHLATMTGACLGLFSTTQRPEPGEQDTYARSITRNVMGAPPEAEVTPGGTTETEASPTFNIGESGIPDAPGVVPPPGHVLVQDQFGRRWWVPISAVGPLAGRGPRKQELNPDQIERIRRFKGVLQEHETTTVEQAVANFERDADPDREIAIFESIASAYTKELADRPNASAHERGLVYAALLSCTWSASIPDLLATRPELKGLDNLGRLVDRYLRLRSQSES